MPGLYVADGSVVRDVGGREPDEHRRRARLAPRRPPRGRHVTDARAPRARGRAPAAGRRRAARRVRARPRLARLRFRRAPSARRCCSSSPTPTTRTPRSARRSAIPGRARSRSRRFPTRATPSSSRSWSACGRGARSTAEPAAVSRHRATPEAHDRLAAAQSRARAVLRRSAYGARPCHPTTLAGGRGGNAPCAGAREPGRWPPV